MSSPMQVSLTDPTTLARLTHIITTRQSKRVVLQLPVSLLPQSMTLTRLLRQGCPADTQFFTLYDSMKKSCCTDVIGARHVDYDLLVHFGYACYSQHYDDRHVYVLPRVEWPGLEQAVREQAGTIREQGIGLVLCDQGVYERVIALAGDLEALAGVEIARLPFDKREQDVYLGFSYYTSQKLSDTKVLVIKPDTVQANPGSSTQNPTSDLLMQNLCLCKKSLSITKLFTLTPSTPIEEFSGNINKKLMQRLSQISQLPKYTTFGILVSNPSTQFCHAQIARCRSLLDAQGLKHFTFMMNNLNEAKLGNFPEIEVYVAISCYNYSLYGIKDFYRLVVSPYDIEVAFGGGGYEDYLFDLQALALRDKPALDQPKQQSQQPVAQKQTKQQKQQEATSDQVAKVNNQLLVHSQIQTLDYYRQREYKGLQFVEKKEVEKVKLGKIGIAAGYRPLTE